MRTTFQGAITALTGISARAANQLATLLVTLVAARAMTPAEFGAFAIAAAFIALVRTLLYSGAFEYLLKTDQPEKSATECLLVNVGVAATFSLLLVPLAFGARSLFGSSSVTLLLLWLAPSNLIAAVTAWEESQVLRGGRVRGYYAAMIVVEAFAAAIAIGMLIFHEGLLSLVAQIYARLLGLSLAYAIVVPRFILSSRLSIAALRSVALWSVSRYGTVLANFGTNYGADILLGIFLSPAATGLYRAANRIATAVSDLVSQPTRIIAATRLSARSAAGRQATDLWPSILGASALLGWTALAALAGLATLIVPAVLGQRWLAAVPLVSILCLARACGLLDSVSSPLLVAYNRQTVILWAQAAVSCGLLLLLVLVARFGPEAAAWSTSLSASFLTLALLASALRTDPRAGPALLEALPVILIPALATYTTILLVQGLFRVEAKGAVAIALTVACGGVAFCATTFLFRRRVASFFQSIQPETIAAIAS